MTEPVRFNFTEIDPSLGELGMMPYLPLTLAYQGRSIQRSGLLDTGASVNVLPYEIGLELGAVWEHQTVTVPLAGNLARFEARAILLTALIDRFNSVNLVFAWTKARNAPLVLGHMNFFLEFDVCFYRMDLVFEIKARRDEDR